VVVKVIDPETGELVREAPPEASSRRQQPRRRVGW
jgi:uncharacterized FlaG/YvyC family protein